MQVRRLEPSFDRYDALLAMIRAAFSYMDARIDPPTSAHRLTPATLKEKALSEIVFVALDEQRLVGCIFCRPERRSVSTSASLRWCRTGREAALAGRF